MDNMNTAAAAPVRKHLPGHVSEETAYVVNDYPYGSLRCVIKFWLEYAPKKGYRMVTRTQNPKNGVWNDPKKSTYSPIAAMYLDEKGHVQWVGMDASAKPEVMKSFVQDFPGQASPIVKVAALAAANYNEKKSQGLLVWTINGVPQPWSDAEKEQAAVVARQYREVMTMIG